MKLTVVVLARRLAPFSSHLLRLLERVHHPCSASTSLFRFPAVPQVDPHDADQLLPSGSLRSFARHSRCAGPLRSIVRTSSFAITDRDPGNRCAYIGAPQFQSSQVMDFSCLDRPVRIASYNSFAVFEAILCFVAGRRRSRAIISRSSVYGRRLLLWPTIVPWSKTCRSRGPVWLLHDLSRDPPERRTILVLREGMVAQNQTISFRIAEFDCGCCLISSEFTAPVTAAKLRECEPPIFKSSPGSRWGFFSPRKGIFEANGLASHCRLRRTCAVLPARSAQFDFCAIDAAGSHQAVLAGIDLWP